MGMLQHKLTSLRTGISESSLSLALTHNILASLTTEVFIEGTMRLSCTNMAERDSCKTIFKPGNCVLLCSVVKIFKSSGPLTTNYGLYNKKISFNLSTRYKLGLVQDTKI